MPSSPASNASAPTTVPGQVSPEDLLTLLAVARLGKYTAAAHSLGINHTTVSRRIAALEKSIGDRVLLSASEGWELTARGRELLSVAEDIEAALSRVYPAPTGSGLTGMVRVAAPEGFCLTWAAPALTELQKRHPGLQIELIASTQRARQYRSGVDIEIMPGRPNVSRSLAYRLNDYSLGLFATAGYLSQHGTPSSEEELTRHRIVYYIEHLHGIDSLDAAGRRLPEAPHGFLRSNSMLIHVRAARAGAGIGLIPTYLGETHPELVRVLPQLDHRITYWASVRKEALRNRGVRAALEVLREFCSRPPETPVAPGR
jgi:DNA-binding transcriptional LysR family regulator